MYLNYRKYGTSLEQNFICHFPQFYASNLIDKERKNRRIIYKCTCLKNSENAFLIIIYNHIKKIKLNIYTKILTV